ncbi:GNAT family N-acetyltransferase [Gallaecimonas mangrovi]|uniref:GNAT family N-acetyltransferase n=1 Tax=Gallaecimonas mangrovi TaxID=2291597 RepID=UPI000E20B462|nr:GNAT family N-acetyltransferase [Gallaecimonas mangrovi]
MTIIELHAQPDAAFATGLATLLSQCVEQGASVSFISPFSEEDAGGFWQQKVFGRLGQPRFCQLLAIEHQQVVGTVLLDAQLPPNQPHRGEVAKLLVSPDYRRRGIARQLMQALEAKARAWQLRLLTLDTANSSNALALYLSLGFEVAGIIPGFALTSDGKHYESTTVMYKSLAAD